MTESLRDTLIDKGWVTNFNADTLVKLIERHYAEETEQSELPGIMGQWINSSEYPPTKQYADCINCIQRLVIPTRGVVACVWMNLGEDELWRPFSNLDLRPIIPVSVPPELAPKVTQSFPKVKLVQITRTIDPKTRIHYLDGIDERGRHWVAQMTHRVEDWITYCKPWQLAPQFPVEL